MVEYLSWSKEKALENLDQDPKNAIISFLRDIQNHPELSDLIDTISLKNILFSHLLFGNHLRIKEVIKSVAL